MIRRGFTLIELLVAMAVFMVVVVILVSTVTSVSSLWQRGIAHNERRSIAISAFSRIARDLRPAGLPADLGGSNLFFLINPGSVSADYVLPQSAFWTSPTATDRSKGDMAVVGYFVHWVTNSSTGEIRPKLCRLFLNPSYLQQQNYSQTNLANWLNSGVLDSNAPANRDSGYAGEVAENVLGLWIQPLDPSRSPIVKDGTRNRTAFTVGTYDSRRGYSFLKTNGAAVSTNYVPSALPASVEVAIVTVDSRTAKKLTGGAGERPGVVTTNLWADVNTFMGNLSPGIRSGAEVHSTIIDLASSPR